MSYYSDLDDDLGADFEAERDLRELGQERRRKQAFKSSSMKFAIKAEVEKQLKAAIGLNRIGTSRVVNPTRGKNIERTCKCNCKFMARQADINRGWAKYCSKSCAAKYKK